MARRAAGASDARVRGNDQGLLRRRWIVETASGDDVSFPERLHLNTLGLRFIIDHERSISAWARWALHQTAEWRSTTDPGSWDHRQVLSSLANEPERERAARWAVATRPVSPPRGAT